MCNCKKQPKIETPYPTPETVIELTDEEISELSNIDTVNEDDDE